MDVVGGDSDLLEQSTGGGDCLSHDYAVEIKIPTVFCDQD
jgi:hypothetical protein